MTISSLGCGLFCELALFKEPYLCISSGEAARRQVLPGERQKGREKGLCQKLLPSLAGTQP